MNRQGPQTLGLPLESVRPLGSRDHWTVSVSPGFSSHFPARCSGPTCLPSGAPVHPTCGSRCTGCGGTLLSADSTRPSLNIAVNQNSCDPHFPDGELWLKGIQRMPTSTAGRQSTTPSVLTCALITALVRVGGKQQPGGTVGGHGGRQESLE